LLREKRERERVQFLTLIEESFACRRCY